MSTDDTMSTDHPITRAWVIPWHGPRLFGVAWETEALNGAFAAGSAEEAEKIAQRLPGLKVSEIGWTEQVATDATERFRRTLLGLDRIDELLKERERRH